MGNIPKKTLWEILAGPDSLRILIPRIQRDYAHGRADKAAVEVRTTLVEELIVSLEKNGSSSSDERVDLGLVFGAADNGEMTLYDGQQRFTTLFLLHWCLAWMARDISAADVLRRFSYNSRLHSRDFCRALTTVGLQIEPNGDKPSQRFLDATWFCPIWCTDPTVAGMLVVLDLMYDRLANGDQEAAELWGKLKSELAPCFSWLRLSKNENNEDLYVKLNSRGRNLTEFEKLKAWLEQQVKENGSWKEVALATNWKRKLDNEWLDLFWRESGSNTETMDSAMLTFFLGNALNLAIATGDGIDEKLIDAVHSKSFLTKDDWHKIFTPQSLPRLLEALDLLIQVEKREEIDQWAKGADVCLFVKNSETPEIALTKAWISGWIEATYTDRFLYFGLLRFLIENPPGSSGWNRFAFHRWMRLVRNLGENSPLANNTLQNAIKSLQSIAPQNLHDLDRWVSKQKIDAVPVGLDKNQWQDEIEKAKLRLAQNCEDTTTALDGAEDQPFLRGQIGFLIAFSTSDEVFDFQRFQSYATRVRRHFPTKEGPTDTESRVRLQQALLSIGDYAGTEGKICLASDIIDWRKVFRRERAKYEAHQGDHQAPQSILKTFLDLGEEIDLHQLINAKGADLDWHDWRKWMLASKYPLGFCQSSRFDVEAPRSTVVLLKGMDYRSAGVELFSYFIFKENHRHPIAN